jgi:4-hydroxy-tetrahydrodipicolinate synthase
MGALKPIGIVPALNTITNKNGELDEEDQRSHVEFNIRSRVHGVAVSIVAGEFYKFSDDERKRIFSIVVDQANGRVPVWAGVSHLGTVPALELARYAKDVGADGIILMPALVGKEATLALYEHFSAVLEKVDIPLMIQDAEDFNGIRMCATLYARLAREYDNLVSVKIEGGNTLEKIPDIKDTLGDRLSILGGMSAKFLLEELKLGARGNIPNLCLSDLLVEVFENYVGGKIDRAREIFTHYKPWVDFMTLHALSSSEVEKETLRLRGIVKSSHTRSPHIPLTEESKAELRDLMKSLELRTTTR